MSEFHLVAQPRRPTGIEAMAALADEAWVEHHGRPDYAATVLRSLPGLADELGVAELLLKDESSRFGLNAFKGLGPSFAIPRWLAAHPDRHDVTFTTATDGNHGRAVAAMARRAGCRAVIFIPAHAVPARIANIRREGADVITVDEGYDAAVELAREAADQQGWVLIQDTSEDVADPVPQWLAAGYWTMARELEPQPHAADRPAVDLVMLHAGVGTWPAAMTAYYWHRYGERRPRLVVVEPIEAACVLQAARTGSITPATGSLHTMMAGLNCGLASAPAMAVLREGVDAFIAIDDGWSARAMRRLATPAPGDPAVVSGESGAAGVAGLMALVEDPGLAEVRKHVGLGTGTRVLTYSTEGATDPDNWARVVGRPVPA